MAFTIPGDVQETAFHGIYKQAMAITHTTPKTALKKGSLSDYFTNSLYGCATYRGCSHGCRYCDGRAERYYVEGDFEKDIEARREMPERLARELCREREHAADGRRCLVSVGSGVTDVYQPLEKSELITRRCAGVFASDADAAGIKNLQTPAYPVLLITKSALILRDFELWKQVHRRRGFILLLSITPMVEELRREVEPGASTMEERWKTAETFIEAGIPVGILAMPLLPGLTDSPEALQGLYDRAANTGVSFVMPGGLTLRPGRQKEFYLQGIRKLPESICRESPEALLKSCQELYGENRRSGAARRSYTRELFSRIGPIMKERFMPFLLPHRVYRTMVPDYEALHILFSHMRELYGAAGTDTAPLRAASDRYALWLKEERSHLRRRRSLSGEWIDFRFRELFGSGELENVLQNRKLSAFCRELQEGAVFDYPSLSLGPG